MSGCCCTVSAWDTGVTAAPSLTPSRAAAQKPRWAHAPSLSLDGDVLLDLGEQGQLRAHLVYLQHASPLFTDVLASCTSEQEPQPADQPAESAPARQPSPQSACSCCGVDLPAPKRQKTGPRLQLPLPDTSRKQALLLLHCLYQHTQPGWAESLGVSELLDLAQTAHKFACSAVLHQADSLLVAAVKAEEALVAQCSQSKQAAAWAAAWLNAHDAPARHSFAKHMNLPGLVLHVEAFMALHANDVDLNAVDGALLGVLRGARQLCTRPVGACSFLTVA